MVKLMFALSLAGFFGAKTYTFDYRLDYDFIDNGKSGVSPISYYVNSKSNAYYADISSAGQPADTFYFMVHGLLSYHATCAGKCLPSDDVRIPDSQIIYFKDDDDAFAKKYTMSNLSDTLIDNKTYKRVRFFYTDMKKAKRRKIFSQVYHIDPSLPMRPLLADPLIWTISRLHGGVPDGAVTEKLVYDSNGHLAWRQQLRKVTPLTLTLEITPD